MNKDEIFKQIEKKQTFLCVGLDPDMRKMPIHLLKEKDPVFEFNKQLIEATADHCVAYKPNIAFYEALGPKGWESLAKTLEFIPATHFTIADAKRGDIGNTAYLYAKTFFDPAAAGLDFDSITVAPYMGYDSVKPFLDFEGKWIILLALTSNPGSLDFQVSDEQGSRHMLFEDVILKSLSWGSDKQIMFVAGATRSDLFNRIREIAPDHFLLVPGVGAQGGDLETVAKNGMNAQCGILVNSSRQIIYASAEKDFARVAASEARHLREQMKHLLDKYLPSGVRDT